MEVRPRPLVAQPIRVFGVRTTQGPSKLMQKAPAVSY
ncbi:hypothetical protein ZHAWSFBX_CDS_0025 [Agrobacterium phage Alfirin]|nr:hypothetical protein ZHAWSFBX_CDS_0025 [Agrobacterium phage Alfirin]